VVRGTRERRRKRKGRRKSRRRPICAVETQSSSKCSQCSSSLMADMFISVVLIAEILNLILYLIYVDNQIATFLQLVLGPLASIDINHLLFVWHLKSRQASVSHETSMYHCIVDTIDWLSFRDRTASS
jgi:hypothetical protein